MENPIYVEPQGKKFKILKLKGKDKLEGKDFAIVNAHLSTPKDENKPRLYTSNNEIVKINEELKKEENNSYIKIVCGDFNNPFYGSNNYSSDDKKHSGSKILTSDGFNDVYQEKQKLDPDRFKDKTNFFKQSEFHKSVKDLRFSNFKGKQIKKTHIQPFANLIDYILYDPRPTSGNTGTNFKIEPLTVLQLPTISEINKYLVDDKAITDKITGTNKVVLEDPKLGLPNLFRTGKPTEYKAGSKMIVFPSDHVPLYAEFKITGGDDTAIGGPSTGVEY